MQLSPYQAACVILFFLFPAKQEIDVYVSLGILNIVEFKVFGLNVISINASPFNDAFLMSFVDESTPINKTVIGSVILVSVFVSSFILFS